jgi:hypothetical protein
VRTGLALLLLLAGVAGAQAATPLQATARACTAARSSSGVEVARSGQAPGPARHFGFAARTAAGAADAQALAVAICRLPYAHGVMHCPIDGSLRYLIGFRGTGVTATADPLGCEIVSGFGSPRTASRAPAFWRALGHAVGLRTPSLARLQGS